MRTDAAPTLAGQEAPIFIVGTQRSGTTLLSALLDRHSRVAVTPETHFIDFLAYNGILDGSRRWTSHGRMVEDLFSTNARLDDLDLDLGSVTRRFSAHELHPRKLLLVILDEFRRGQDQELVLEKTPRHLLFLHVIWGWYPAAKVLCIVRDGRAVANSLRKVPFGHEHLWEHSAEWMYQSTIAHEAAARVPERFRCIRYEDLVLSPRETLREVGRFLEFGFEPSQLDPEVEVGVVPKWELEWKGRVMKELDPDRISAWRDQTTQSERRLMTTIMAEGLRSWGYPIPPEDLEGAGSADRLRRLLCRGWPYRLIRLRAVARQHVRHRRARWNSRRDRGARA